MNSPALFCAALLFVIPALAQQSTPPAAQASAAPTVPAQPAPPPAESRPLQVVCTSASHASELIGKNGCVAGRVFRVTIRKTGNTHLSLCPSRKCSFQAVVSARNRAKVGDLSYLHGKFIAVIGDVTASRAGHPVIAVKDRQQIRVAAGDPPPEFDSAQAKPFSTGQRGSKRGSAW